MTETPNPALAAASANLAAVQKEMEAAIIMFEAAVFRGNTHGLTVMTERAHEALQARLDAFAGLYGLAKKHTGEG